MLNLFKSLLDSKPNKHDEAPSKSADGYQAAPHWPENVAGTVRYNRSGILNGPSVLTLEYDKSAEKYLYWHRPILELSRIHVGVIAVALLAMAMLGLFTR